MGEGTDSDFISKEIDVEDVGAMTPCGQLATMDSDPTPNVSSPLQLWNQSIQNPRNQARSTSLGEGADSDSVCKPMWFECEKPNQMCKKEMMSEKLVWIWRS